MQYMNLGQSGIKVSKIGIGVWQASDEWHGDDEQVIKAIETAGELGVNLVDTAEVYGAGHSETGTRTSISPAGPRQVCDRNQGCGRASKVRRTPEGSELPACEDWELTSIDLYQVHWPDPWEQIPLRETMKALEKLFLEGKIRAIGVSNFAVRDLEEARSYLSRTDIVSNQSRYNLLQRNIEEEVLPYCKRENIAILAWSPLAQGALSGKYNSKNMPKGDVRAENILFVEKNMLQVEKLISVLSDIAKSHMCTVSQVALNWLASNPLVIPIPGVKNSAQARENLGSLDFQLSIEELDEIEKVCREIKIDYYPSAEGEQIEMTN